MARVNPYTSSHKRVYTSDTCYNKPVTVDAAQFAASYALSFMAEALQMLIYEKLDTPYPLRRFFSISMGSFFAANFYMILTGADNSYVRSFHYMNAYMRLSGIRSLYWI